jgi:hypothetical protein
MEVEELTNLREALNDLEDWCEFLIGKKYEAERANKED